MPAAENGRRPWRWLHRLLVGALAGYLLWCTALVLLAPGLLFLPQVAGPGLDERRLALLDGVERLWIAHDDGEPTEAWLARTDDVPTRGLVVFTHGNAELIDRCEVERSRWTARGFDVLEPEYRGYGRSPGSPSEAAIVGDAVDALRETLLRTQYPMVILHGRSLGTGVAAQVAARLAADPSLPAPAALVLESPFTSIVRFAAGLGVPAFLVRDSFRTDLVVRELACPLLVLHARRDEVVPFEHGASLAESAPDGVLCELDGSHNSGLSSTTPYWRAVDGLLERLAADPSGG